MKIAQKRLDNGVFIYYNKGIMAYENYLARIKERDANLIKYLDEHPGMSQRALGKVFKISQARVSKILTRKKQEDHDT